MNKEMIHSRTTQASSILVDAVVMRHPRTNLERMTAALRSTNDDLYPDGNGRVVVAGRTNDGELIYLGEFDETLLYTKGVNPMSVIERIRFCV